MCINVSDCIESRALVISCSRRQRSRRSKVRVHRFITRRKRNCGCEEIKTGKEMEIMKNLKLCMENITILEENKKLRKKVSRLHQENLALMSEFQRRFSPVHHLSATLFLLPAPED